MAEQPPLYEEEIAASEPIRTEQADELTRYLAWLREDRSALHAIFRPDYSSPRAYQASTRKLRHALQNSFGYPPPAGTTPEGWSTGREEAEFRGIGEDHLATYYRTRIPVLPGVHAVGLYLVPRALQTERRGRAALVIAMHGGQGSPELATFHGGTNYHDMVRGAVGRGYVVWAPQHLFDAQGYPEDIRQRIDSRARLVGTSIVAIEIAMIRRGLDVILPRPEVDRRRVAMIGLSYGGFYTLCTTALEPRIRVGVASCWFGDWAEHFDRWEPHGGSDGRFPGGLSLFRDPEVVALICPRPLQIQMGSRDGVIPAEPARAVAPLAAAYYAQLGLPERFRFVEFPGRHEFCGSLAWEFLAEHL